MRLRSVRARSFGGFVDRELEFAEGLTIVTGPNESGKSTWHAAITAAVCGMRRGRGRRRLDDQAFVDRYHPWDRDEFTVAGLIELSDGRLVEMHHDLAGLVDCTATDAVLGTDLSAEILNEGTPDAARFVGLDRTGFRAIARVSQGEILAVLEDAEVLQEDLHRAAATAGSDETAAAAIQIIDEVRRDEIGRDIANSTRPLRRAREALAAAEAAEEEIRRTHDRWRSEQEQITVMAGRADEARARLAAVEAEIDRARLQRARVRLAELEELDAEVGSGSVTGPVPDAAVLDEVREAVRAWAHRPEPVPPTGQDAETLAARLEALPDPPVGDVEPAPEVVGAARVFGEKRADVAAHARLEPEIVGGLLPAHLDVATVEDLRGHLTAAAHAPTAPAAPVSDPPSGPAAGRVRSSARTAVAGGGAALVVAGAITWLLGRPIPGSLMVLAGIVLGIAALLTARNRLRPEVRPVDRVASPVRSEPIRTPAAETARDLGLPDDPVELARLLDRHRRAESSRRSHHRWAERGAELRDELAAATERLAGVLRTRGVTIGDGAENGDEAGTFGVGAVAAALDRYRDDCRRRADDHRAAAERPLIEEYLTERRAADLRHERAVETVERLRDALRRLADRHIVPVPEPDADPEELVRALTDWSAAAEAAKTANDAIRERRARLEALLAGRTLDEHRRELIALEARAAESADAAWGSGGSVEGAASGTEGDDDPVARREALRDEVARTGTELARLTAAHRVRSSGLPSVAEAVEAVEAARAEVARIERFDADLAATRRFLEAAQAEVNRDIAPRLAASVRRDIARVTSGRYDDVRINPADLTVTVRDRRGRWPRATGLSHGTAEQIHLLLRFALADAMVAEGRRVPMLLDDVLVQSDRDRSRALLELFRDRAAARQIILFSQEEFVREWARTELAGHRNHAHIELPSPS